MHNPYYRCPDSLYLLIYRCRGFICDSW